MTMITPTIASFLAMIIPAFASLILFVHIRRRKILFDKSFFWNYAFGFAIITLSGFPIYLINLGIQISYNSLLLLFALSFITAFAAYLLFYRGTILLFTTDRFVTTAFPNIILPFISLFAMAALFYIKLPTILIYTAMAWGFLFPNNMYLSALFLYFFAKGTPLGGTKRRFCTFILTVGWFIMLGLDIILWINAALYLDPNLWILKIASMKGWFLMRSLSYLIILIGVLLHYRCFKNSSVTANPSKQ
ncbi:MAG: hypothetical protein PHE52_02495 [Candidatus Pacebacteria bacterium]|nr:hypothetical protein [Candidatus Paceibacterota bacterium]